ncbi:MAG: RNA polymerase sigma factor [Vicinamibacterales bacterium]
MTTRMPDDVRLRALMATYQAGDLQAFDELYRALMPAVRGVLRRLSRDGARVDDLVQETFLQLHRARRSYDPAHPVLPWVVAIARHVWLMDRRTRSRRPQTDGATLVEPPVAAEAERYADRAEVRDALRRVPSARRKALIAHHVVGFSFREIARRAGINVAAAKLRSSRGMADLRRLLSRGDTNDDDA